MKRATLSISFLIPLAFLSYEVVWCLRCIASDKVRETRSIGYLIKLVLAERASGSGTKVATAYDS